MVDHFWDLRCAKTLSQWDTIQLSMNDHCLGHCNAQWSINDRVLRFKMDIVSPHTWTKVCSAIRPSPRPTMWDHMRMREADGQPSFAPSSVQKTLCNFNENQLSMIDRCLGHGNA